jgi:hypothetical protein
MSDFTSPTNINMRGDWGGVVEYGSDRNMFCAFYYKPVPNPAKAAESGHPFFEDQVFVRIHPPGERLNIVERRATEQDKRRFPMQWQQFQQNATQQPDGAPVEMLYPDMPSIAAMLRANGVSTIEQVSDLSGPAIDTIGMGSQRYVNDAKKWLEMAAKGKNASQMRRELEIRDREISTLTKAVETLKAQIEEMRDAAVRQPNLAQLQTMIAGAMQRPQHMPAQSFDPQSAMINATGQAIRPTEKPRRQRPRIAR